MGIGKKNADQAETPVIDALAEFNKKQPAYFCIPGHRFEQGMPDDLKAAFGENIFRYDLTEADGLDDLQDPHGAIDRAQKLAAEAFGADRTWFSVNGTTAANIAMILACAGPGEEILIARNSHKSVMRGLILSGAKPVWIEAEYDEAWGIATGTEAGAVEKALNEHPDAKAVMIVSPTYYGTASDVKAISDICHARGIPLLVDEAHGTHFAFSERLPGEALRSGADLVSMSIHKTAGAMTQSSMLHFKDYGSVDPSRVDTALKMVMSTSPSYVLMSSLDAARKQLAFHGKEMADRAVGLALLLRKKLQSVPGIAVFGGANEEELKKNNIDITRVTFSAFAAGMSGTYLKERLFEESRISLEMADAANVVAVITFANEEKDIERLAEAVKKVLSAQPGAERTADFKNSKDNFRPEKNADFANSANCGNSKNISRLENIAKPAPAEIKMLPRDAYFAEGEHVFIREAKGRISKAVICPYPPGIPYVNPGELITEDIVVRLLYCLEQGIPVHGIDDNCIIEVVKIS